MQRAVFKKAPTYLPLRQRRKTLMEFWYVCTMGHGGKVGEGRRRKRNPKIKHKSTGPADSSERNDNS